MTEMNEVYIYITLDSTAEIKHIVNAYIGAVISLSSSPFPPTSICLLLFVEVVLSPLCCAGTYNLCTCKPSASTQTPVQLPLPKLVVFQLFTWYEHNNTQFGCPNSKW